ncbi:MAG: threonine/serine dehydratase [Ktedonobacterales bacterium]|nr:threonine/serine dehydratase [Ktedonobacterales bacterium]
MITLDPAAIAAAATRIAPLARRTPVERSALLAEAGNTVWLKMEIWQATGSFKMRGALNRMAQLDATERAGGVVTASAGNHAQGVAACAVALGIHATIVVAADASPAKVAALRRYDAQWVELRQLGRDYDEAEAAGIALARELERPFISPYNDAAVIAGQGTVAHELLEDLPDLDVIVVPVGGGGLAAGIGVWAHHVNPAIRVIGVQSEASPAMHAAFAAGALVTVPLAASLADGLAGNIEPGSITYALCRAHLASVALVTEDAIAVAMRYLMETQHVLVEGSGAVGVAALLSGAVVVPPGSRVGVILSGRNVTLDWVRRVLS